jgi:short-subunit dehydrogenase
VSEGRVIIVTGASSGIGRALAERAARAGFRVLATGRRAERLDELKRIVHGASGAMETLALDLLAPGAPATIVRETLARYGRIDVLVNNAGGVATGPIGEQSDAALHEQFETHVIVPLALTREALPELRRTRGQIFYVGSGVARVPVGGLGAYPAAKAAVRNMVRIVRNEVRGDGIGVTYIDPGAVASEFMTRAGFAGPPRFIAAQPFDVAARIFEAVKKRRPVVNAVPWQTALVALAEAFPGVTDFLLSKAPQIVGTALPPAATPATPMPPPRPSVPGRPNESAPPGPSESSSAAPASSTSASSTPVSSLPTLSEPASLPTSSEPASSSAPAPGTGQYEPPSDPATANEPERIPTKFEAALAPHAVRMRKLNLSSTFVASLLNETGRTLDAGDVSMRWAGMPNKNERALTTEVLDALSDAGFLTRAGEDIYLVARSADDEADAAS